MKLTEARGKQVIIGGTKGKEREARIVMPRVAADEPVEVPGRARSSPGDTSTFTVNTISQKKNLQILSVLISPKSSVGKWKKNGNKKSC
jgi:hypothetical protein